MNAPDRRAAASSLASTLAHFFVLLKELGSAERGMANQFLRNFLLGHAEILGVWSVWEPDAFDGRDRNFRDAPGHDESGRFIPFWHRLQGEPTLEPNTNYDKPESGEWYWMPSLRAEEMVFDAYEHPVDGRPMMISTQAAPIVVQGNCLGVVGIDVRLETLWEQQQTPAVAQLEASLGSGHLLISREGEVRAISAVARTLLRAASRPTRPRKIPAVLENGFADWSAKGGEIAQQVRIGERDFRLRFTAHPELQACVVVIKAVLATGRALFPEAGLTAREREVLAWLSRGKSNEEISLILGISAHTAKHHVEHIFAKLGVENRYAAAALFREESGRAQ